MHKSQDINLRGEGKGIGVNVTIDYTCHAAWHEVVAVVAACVAWCGEPVALNGWPCPMII